jgi:predicted ATP-dependent serine protease
LTFFHKWIVFEPARLVGKANGKDGISSFSHVARTNCEYDYTLYSGCAGLDVVLGGGLPIGRFYLIEGEPGTPLA